ncbi:MAG TPA: cytochrome c [Bryobacteraceae bacterium]|nr:cytochrome c [Bryobacteraceae bacterium]
MRLCLIVFIGLAGSRMLLHADDKTARGSREFVSACGFCHGNDATGNRAPDLIRSQLVNHDENGNLIAPVIREGRPDKGMPAFPALSAQQVSDIVGFLHARVAESLGSSHVPNDYPLAKLLTGSASQGKAYFEGEGGCKNCHSATGDLAGIARKYSPIDLQSRFLYPHGPKPTATVKLQSGQQVDGRLMNIDEFDVGIRDKSGQYRSFSRDHVQVSIHDPMQVHRELLSKYSDADVHNLFAYLETLK